MYYMTNSVVSSFTSFTLFTPSFCLCWIFRLFRIYHFMFVHSVFIVITFWATVFNQTLKRVFRWHSQNFQTLCKHWHIHNDKLVGCNFTKNNATHVINRYWIMWASYSHIKPEHACLCNKPVKQWNSKTTDLSYLWLPLTLWKSVIEV